MRLGFFGTPAVAAQYLAALWERHTIVGVVTQPDRARGRSGEPPPSPVQQLLGDRAVAVLQPARGECPQACARLQAERPDLCVVVAFGQKLPCGVIECLTDRCINVHYSLLPALRGAAPVQHAILQGLAQTGVTIQHVAPGLDEGDIILQRSLDILPEDTCGSLTARLTPVGVELLLVALDALAAGTAPRTPQDHSQATPAPSIRKADGNINWCEPAELIARKVRAYNPWPGAMTHLGKGPVKVLRARAASEHAGQEGQCGRVVEASVQAGLAIACGRGRLWLEEVQAAGKKPMAATEFLRGARLEVGMPVG